MKTSLEPVHRESLQPVRGERLRTALDELAAWGEARGWRGSDPYEALNARRTFGLARTALGRRVLIQAVKRSPVDLRGVLGIPPRHNAMALAHVVSAYARAPFPDAAERDRRLEAAVRTLRGLTLEGYRAPCWGYHFDVETRVFFYASTTPNTIATSFAGLSLLDAYELTRDEGLLDLAAGAAEFFLGNVPQTEDGEGAYFGYLPGDRSPIHNSSMLVCALLARVAQARPDERLTRAAAAGIEWCVTRQRPDGSWPYGERDNLAWVDGFHTGYVLACLLACERAGFAAQTAEPLRRGLDFYARRLFLADGTPRYYADQTFPIDAQCVAQGIETLALAGAHVDGAYTEQAWRVFDFALRAMRRRDGAFAFQRRRLWRNPVPHVRWVQAPMLQALATLMATTGDAT